MTTILDDAIYKEIEKMAYYKWLNAGGPENRSLDFWQEAKQEWLATHEYYEFYFPGHQNAGGEYPAERFICISEEDANRHFDKYGPAGRSVCCIIRNLLT